jgi:hypothetical protein
MNYTKFSENYNSFKKINLSQQMFLYTHRSCINYQTHHYMFYTWIYENLKQYTPHKNTRLVSYMKEYRSSWQSHYKFIFFIFKQEKGEIGRDLLFRLNAVINRIIRFQFKFIQDPLCSPQIRRVAFNVICHVNLKIQRTILAKCPNPINCEF